MNYLRQTLAFYDWLETNGLDASCIALWHGLMAIANKAGWPDEFAAARSLIEAKTGLKKDAQHRARNTLKQKGRIEYWSRPGRQSTMYRIIPFVSVYKTQDSEASEIQTQDNNASVKPTGTPTQPATQGATQTAPAPRPVLNVDEGMTKGEVCIFAIYARACAELPPVQVINEDLMEKVRAAWEEHPDRYWWEEFFDLVWRTDYLMGRTGNSWTASLPWLLDNVDKVRNGEYGVPISPQEALKRRAKAYMERGTG